MGGGGTPNSDLTYAMPEPLRFWCVFPPRVRASSSPQTALLFVPGSMAVFLATWTPFVVRCGLKGRSAGPGHVPNPDPDGGSVPLLQPEDNDDWAV